MSTTAPVSHRNKCTIVNGPSRKMMATLQVSIDLATDKGESPRGRVIFTLRDWNGNGSKEFASGPKTRRSVVVTKIDWSNFDHDGLITIEGIMTRGIMVRGIYDPHKREGELFTGDSDMF